MSLKGFHVFFIALATLLCFGFCAWSVVLADPVATGGGVRVVGLASGLAGLGLAAYGVWFVRCKAKTIIT